MNDNYSVIMKSRAIAQLTVGGRDHPVYVELLRTSSKEGSLLPRRRLLYEVRCVCDRDVMWRRQFNKLGEARSYYDNEII
jgi:hypothetical protein